MPRAARIPLRARHGTGRFGCAQTRPSVAIMTAPSGASSMRIGLFYQIQVPKPWTAQSEAQRIYEALEQIPYAEEQGFDSVWFSEHHFRPVWSHNSAPDLTLAAVSQRTSRIRLGIGVVLAPIHHPLHVAQRMATLDILEPWPGRCRDRPHRLSLPAHPVRHRSEGHARHVAGIRRGIAAPVDREGDLLRRNLLQNPASRGPAEAGAKPASAAVVGLRQRRDGAADRQPRDGRAVRRRGRPQPCPRADGAVPRGSAHSARAMGRQRRRAPR